MPQSDRDNSRVDEDFSLTLDDYGRLWLHTKLQGVEVAIDLADKEHAFRIMAEKMTACGFEYRPVPAKQSADNDQAPQT